MKRLHYWRRIFNAYILNRTSQLSFWHEDPKISKKLSIETIGPYYMSFDRKATYNEYCDKDGIPRLNYQGVIGVQYNPIAISQWGLGNYNKWYETKSEINYLNFIKSSDWLINNLQQNHYGLKVWMHHFNFEYRDTLIAPWYSGLAQGQGISVLIRAYKETGDQKYAKAIKDAFASLDKNIDMGGVKYTDINGLDWIEEYIVRPPTHILNGFIWALWGIFDHYLYFRDNKSKQLFNKYSNTIIKNLYLYDIGYWSKYELSNTKIPMIASSFYHKLHITQLEIMYILTKKNAYKEFSSKWQKYFDNRIFKSFALTHKSIFKVFYY